MIIHPDTQESRSRGEGVGKGSGRAGGFKTALGYLILVIASFGGGCGEGEAGPPPPQPEIGTEVGNRSPGLSGVLADESAFSLDGQLSGLTVLIFYRSAQCGLCRLQLEEVQRHLPAYDYQGARIVGVTLDAPEMSSILINDLPLGFDLVSVQHAVFDEWQVSRSGAEAPLPATFVVDRDGIVRYRHIGRNAADRASDAGLLTVLQTLRQ